MAAQEAIAGSHERELKADIERYLKFIDSPRQIPLPEILEAIETSKETGKSIITGLHRVLNIYESYARGIRVGLYDEEVIRSSRKIPMISTYEVFKEYIPHRTAMRNDNPWPEYEALVIQWLGK